MNFSCWASSVVNRVNGNAEVAGSRPRPEYTISFFRINLGKKLLEML